MSEIQNTPPPFIHSHSFTRTKHESLSALSLHSLRNLAECKAAHTTPLLWRVEVKPETDTAAEQAYKCRTLPGSAKVTEVQRSLFNLHLFLRLNLTALEDNIVAPQLKPLYYNEHLGSD